ncbi:site-specific DNA-methyltransferase, partial [Candidatus Roizmanbacteria bacterium CG09_land_8_20_14_0_10_41_9]
LYSKDWHNLLVFGDNLQILKTFNENKDPLVKNKIKGKVKLIYIDPPFGTGDEYDGAKGQSAYSAKKKGADFVEFLRRRLILLKELMASDGAIFVRMDYHFGHYLKLIMDEVFDKGSFKNEVIIKRGYVPKGKTSQFPTATDSLFFYSKTDIFNLVSNTKSIEEKDRKWISLDMPGERKNRNIRPRIFLSKKLYPPKDQHWGLSQKRISELEKQGDIRINTGRTYIDTEGKTVKGMPEFLKEPFVLLNSNWTDIKSYETHNTFYPTENSEELLERIINSCTNEGDLVIDVFAGSGTTAAVAEKSGRRWVCCDIGKLAIYTIQKRLLEIDKSKDLEDKKQKYDKPAKSFAVVTSGLYNLGKVFALQKDEYINFVKNLFEIEETKTAKIGGVEIDGRKREFYTKIFPYWELKNASVDEKYLQELHKNIGGKIDDRFYIIAPANNVNFISDYHQIGNVRYYFLKVPYQIIKELHKVQFKKFRQPQSKGQINDLDEAIGFHFIRQPEVKSEIKKLKDKVVLKIKKFESAYSQDETGEKLKNFESLAMLLVDLNYDGEKFMMTNYYFAQDLLNHKPSDEEESEEEIKKELKKQKEIRKEFPKKDCGKKIMAIYVDIYGNEFREMFKIK